MHISSISLQNGDELLLYAMNGQYITMQVNQHNGKAVWVDATVQREMLHLFTDKIVLPC